MEYIYLIVAPSGAGKTTIVESLESKYGLKSIKSYTTRPPRFNGETGHIFISDEEFDQLTDIVAYTKFNNNRYCAVAKQVKENDLYVIDPKGVEFFKQHYNGSKQIKVVYIESNVSTRFERMVKREIVNDIPHSQAVDKALERIVNDAVEFYDYVHHKTKVDYTIMNNGNTTLESVVDEIYRLIISNTKE